MNATGIVEKLKQYFAECPYPVALAYLFGSHAKGHTTPLSDVDVAVLLREADPHKREEVYLGLLVDLIRCLETDRVDLALLTEGEDGIGARIPVEGVLVSCQDEAARVRIEKKALDRYQEKDSLGSVRQAYVRKRIKGGCLGEGGAEMIDRQAVEERLAYIDQMLRHLKGYRGLTLEQFERDEARCHAALYELQTALEAVADIGNHLIAALNLRKPKARGEVVTILAEAGIIPTELARHLAQAIGLRHVIVHGYLHIVIALVHRIIQERLSDLEEFCRTVVAFLDRGTP
ncbi:MAG: HepT-like ribonuclease domain-containing protein [Candidatus Methylomirabilales bacterium]